MPRTSNQKEIIMHFIPLDIENLLINVNELTFYNKKKILKIIFKLYDSFPFNFVIFSCT